ncbi:MAG: hypothetical protein RI955_1363 [Bacteroidota bacterium]
MILDKSTSTDPIFGINNKPIFAQLMIFVGTAVLCFSVFGGFGQLWLNHSIGAENVNEFLQHPLQNMQHINAFKWMQLCSSAGMFGLSALLFAFLKNKNGFAFLKMNKLPKLDIVSMIVPITLCSLPIIAFVYYYNQQIHFGAIDKIIRDLENQNGEITKAMLNTSTIAGLMFNLIVVAIIPGIVEELFFRGALQNLLHEGFKNKHVAIIATGIIFSAIHFEFLGFVPRMMMGIMLGYMYVWTGNIWTNIAAHVLNNGISVVAYFLFNNGYIKTDIDKMDHYGTMPTLVAVILFVAVFYLFYKKTAPQNVVTN